MCGQRLEGPCQCSALKWLIGIGPKELWSCADQHESESGSTFRNVKCMILEILLILAMLITSTHDNIIMPLTFPFFCKGSAQYQLVLGTGSCKAATLAGQLQLRSQ